MKLQRDFKRSLDWILKDQKMNSQRIQDEESQRRDVRKRIFKKKKDFKKFSGRNFQKKGNFKDTPTDRWSVLIKKNSLTNSPNDIMNGKRWCKEIVSSIRVIEDEKTEIAMETKKLQKNERRSYVTRKHDSSSWKDGSDFPDIHRKIPIYS